MMKAEMQKQEVEAIFKFLWKQEVDAEAVLKVLLPLPLLPNITLTFLLKLLVLK